MLFPIIPLYCKYLGFAPYVIGIVVSGFSLLSIPLAIPLGRLMDRFSPIKGVKIGFFFNLLSSFILIIGKSLYVILISQLISGLGFLFIVVGAQAIISSFKNFSKKAEGFGKLALYGAMGQGIGPFLGGLIIEKKGFFTLFLISLILSVPGLFIRDKSLDEKRMKNKYNKNSPIPLVKEIFHILRKKNIILALIFTSISVFTTTLRSSFLPIFLQQDGYLPNTIGILISIFSVFMFIVRFFIGRLFKKISTNKLLYITMFFFSLGFFIIPIQNNLLTIGLGICLWGIGFGISQPLSMLIISENIEKDNSGLGMGIRFTAITTSAFIAPIIFGFITEYMDITYNFYLSSILCIIFIVVLFFNNWKHK